MLATFALSLLSVVFGCGFHSFLHSFRNSFTNVAKLSEILHHEDVALVEFMYTVFTCMLCELL